MQKLVCSAFAILGLAVLALAGAVSYVSTWKNPVAHPLDRTGKKVATFVISADESMRLGPEETLAAELRSRGVDCVAGYTVLPGELARDKEKAQAFLKRVGVAYAILIRVAGKAEELHYMPGTAWYAGPYYSSFWGYWDYGWSTVYSPGYVYADTVVSLETMVYSVEENTLLWAGLCRVTNPKDIRKVVKEIADAAGKKMRKECLIQ